MQRRLSKKSIGLKNRCNGSRATQMNNEMERWEKEKGVRFLKKIGVRTGQCVLDFGVGVGKYCIPAALIVGNDGVVYAVDKEKKTLEEIKEKPKTNIKNLETKLKKLENKYKKLNKKKYSKKDLQKIKKKIDLFKKRLKSIKS